MIYNKYTLKEIATIRYGKNQKNVVSSDGSFPIYGTGGLMGYASKYLYDKPSVLIGRKGTIDKVRYVTHPFWTVDTLFYTEINDAIVLPHFLYYVLSLLDLRKYNEGTSIPSLRTETLNRLELYIPPLSEQKKILSFIEPIEEKIDINTRINRNLLEQAETLFQSWFVDYEHFGGCCPEDWTEGVLEDVVDFFNGYAFKGSELLDAPDPNNECYHVFKQGHINRGGGFNISGTKSWFPKKDSEKLSRYVLRKGDILMAMTDMKNNVAILGNTAVMEMDDTYILNQRVALLRANGTFGIEYPFVYLLTNSIDFISDLRSRANSGVQVNLSATEIKNSKLMIPSTEVNKEFNSLVHPLFEAMIEHDLENLRLGELRDALLPKLMSGELDLSDVDL